MAKKDSEFGLLCCVARDNDVMAQCGISNLAASDFESPLYRYIYAKMLKLYTSQTKKIDEVTLRTETDARMDDLLHSEGIDRNRFLNALFTSAVSLHNAEAFIEDIMESSLQKAVNADLDDFVSSKKANKLTTAEYLTGMEDILQRAYARGTPDAPQILGGGSGLFDQISMREEQTIMGLATPWPTINQRLAGLPNGSLTMWLSPTGTGKTSSMINMMVKTAFVEKFPALFIGTEMNMEEIMLRTVSCYSGVRERDLRLNKNWRTSDALITKVKTACDTIDALDTFHYICMPDFSLSKIRGHAIRTKMRYGIRLLIFDYLSEPEDADSKNRQEWQNLSNFVLRLKGLARQLETPIVFTAQTPLMGRRDTMTLEDVAMARYMSFHVDHVIGVCNKTNKTMANEAALNLRDIGNQKAYIIKGRHGGESHQAQGHKYLNFQYDRDIIRVREGIAPHERQVMD